MVKIRISVIETTAIQGAVMNINEIKHAIKTIEEKNNIFDIDGVVVKVNDYELQAIMGRHQKPQDGQLPTNLLKKTHNHT